MILRTLTVCLSCSVLVLSAPQRSVQLGGAGPRPVALGPAIQPNIYTQQLSFGPPQPQILSQPSPSPQQQQQAGRVRISTHNLQQRPQQNQPIILQQSSLPNQGNPLPPFPGAVRQQPIALRSPTQQLPVAQDEEEYDDEEYEEEQQQQQPARPSSPSPSPRPLQQQQRVQQVRLTPQPILLSQQPQPSQPGPGPQRFIIPQQIQPQPTPQQIRQRPVQQRVPTAAPIPTSSNINQYQPQIIQQQQLQARPGHQPRQQNRLSTPAPVQTIDRFMRNNPDGSITWGYTNEDGTFKEETLGADCVVRGKYGYVDPDGQKREYEYSQGNPCDPNKRNQPEEDEEVIGGPSSQQKLGGLLVARPGQQQQQQQLQQLQRRPPPQQQQLYQQ